MPTKLEWAYFAGIIDGEGSICIVQTFRQRRLSTGIVKKYRTVELRLSVSNTNERIIAWLKVKFGGVCHPVKRARKDHTQCWHWEITQRRAAKVIEGVIPFLVAKTAQAELAIAFQSSKKRYGRPGAPITVKQKENDMRAKMQILNGGRFLRAS